MNPHDDFDPDMITMNPRRWRPGRTAVVTGVAVVALAGGAGIGYAATHSLNAKGATDAAAIAAATPPASPSSSASGQPLPAPATRPGWRGFAAGMGRLGALGLGPAGVLHGQLTVPKAGGGYQTLDVQDGTVTAVSTGSLTVKSTDGFTATYTVTSKTVVDAQAAGIGSVRKGDTVFVTATATGSTPTAASVIDVTAVKAGRASFGFPKRPASPPAQVPAPSA
jgi:hypothetical protein